MSRSGRPSERAKRAPHKRNLIGPDEILERIQAAGGVPDHVVDELGEHRPTDAAERAGAEMQRLVGGVIDSMQGRGGTRANVGDDPARQMAWILSVTTSMRESVPKENWCRHMLAADPRLTEIRTIAVLSAGIWQCLECFRQAGPLALKVNLWPHECDLCGVQTESFNEIAGNIPGCMVTASVCSRCASFPAVRAE